MSNAEKLLHYIIKKIKNSEEEMIKWTANTGVHRILYDLYPFNEKLLYMLFLEKGVSLISGDLILEFIIYNFDFLHIINIYCVGPEVRMNEIYKPSCCEDFKYEKEKKIEYFIAGNKINSNLKDCYDNSIPFLKYFNLK